ncbi:MAG TPA: 6-carboxytetrahydropterin synthase [Gammaproteobacteria bacterium]|nr:6-carboxytetrahydropterin synthase [Gammaproteobacteria bacterium]
MKQAIVALHNEEHSFSAGHFTIFSETDREDLHGHNYYVHVSFTVTLNHNGMAFDYRIYKKKLQILCDSLDRKFLLPQYSPYLSLEDKGNMWLAHFNHEPISFLKRDAMILPITNITIEELSHWFLQQLTQDFAELTCNSIAEITVKVFNGPGQSSAANFKI